MRLPMRGRTRFSFPFSGRPKMVTVPDVGTVSPRSIFMVVVLPAPLRPRRP